MFLITYQRVTFLLKILSCTEMLDTNTCIYIMNQKPEHVTRRFEENLAEEMAISTISYGELLFGAYKSQSHQKAIHKLESFIGSVPPLPLPSHVAEYYGKIRLALEKKGKSIGGNDLWIAAHALSLNLTLITNNGKEFKRIAELKIENWC